MADPFLAEIRIWGCNFAPTGWAFCNGQLIPISQNTALFSLLGTYYGGDGKSTFALPNLAERVPIHVGGDQPGKGLSTYDLGQAAGTPAVTLLGTEMASHSHSYSVSGQLGLGNSPENQMFAVGDGVNLYAPANNLTPMAPESLSPAGSDLPHNNMMPYLYLNYCIAMQGIFPPRG